ncbi:MAG TPA: (d)CMP kinase [Candidatus Dormibacteraeota bacterium]|nr:(d)CMP kinase [Candidatus Dormibacteraeota bacterium]
MSRVAPVVTIDGPAGVGKSTVGRSVARVLHLPFVDTGIFYRALTAAASRAEIEAGDSLALQELAAAVRLEVNSDPDPAPGAWQARADGQALTEELWDSRLAALLADIARQPGVRQSLLAAQRRPAAQGVVAVGRDTGTVVFPDADCKVYLDAPAEVRVARRRKELLSRGRDASDEVLRADVLTRDQTDLSRVHAPLAVPSDALSIDTSALSAEEVVNLVLSECRRRGLSAGAEAP